MFFLCNMHGINVTRDGQGRKQILWGRMGMGSNIHPLAALYTEMNLKVAVAAETDMIFI